MAYNRKCNLILKSILCFIFVTLCAFFFSSTAFAADEKVELSFDQQQEVNSRFTIHVEITSDTKIGAYYVELEYDTSRLEYYNGAERTSGGMIILTGGGSDTTITYDIEMKAIASGEAGIYVKGGKVWPTSTSSDYEVNYSESDEYFKIEEGSVLPITVAGESNDVSFADMLELRKVVDYSGVPVTAVVEKNDGSKMYIIDLTQFVPDGIEFDYKLAKTNYLGTSVTCLTDSDGKIQLLAVLGEDGKISWYSIGENNTLDITAASDSGNSSGTSSKTGRTTVLEDIRQYLQYGAYVIAIVVLLFLMILFIRHFWRKAHPIYYYEPEKRQAKKAKSKYIRDKRSGRYDEEIEEFSSRVRHIDNVESVKIERKKKSVNTLQGGSDGNLSNEDKVIMPLSDTAENAPSLSGALSEQKSSDAIDPADMDIVDEISNSLNFSQDNMSIDFNDSIFVQAAAKSEADVKVNTK